LLGKLYDPYITYLLLLPDDGYRMFDLDSYDFFVFSIFFLLYFLFKLFSFKIRGVLFFDVIVLEPVTSTLFFENRGKLL
jgi:hypothetical protein